MALQPFYSRYVVSHCEALHLQIRQLAISAFFFQKHHPEIMIILTLKQQSVLRGLAF